MEERYYAEYSRMEREHWWFRARRVILGNVLDSRLQTAHPLRILDVGCGTGASSKHLSKWGDVTSFDISHQALSFCRKVNDTTVVQGDATVLPFADDSFDLVCGLDIIEHLHDDAKAVAELTRVCKPGGQLLLTVPALQCLWSDHDLLNHHFRRYRLKQLQTLADRAHLDVDVITYFNTLLFPLVAPFRVLGRIRRWFRPGGEVVSDFAHSHGGRLGWLFERVFAFEKKLVDVVQLPIGVSLLCFGTKPASPEAVSCCTEIRTCDVQESLELVEALSQAH